MKQIYICFISTYCTVCISSESAGIKDRFYIKIEHKNKNLKKSEIYRIPRWKVGKSIGKYSVTRHTSWSTFIERRRIERSRKSLARSTAGLSLNRFLSEGKCAPRKPLPVNYLRIERCIKILGWRRDAK